MRYIITTEQINSLLEILDNTDDEYHSASFKNNILVIENHYPHVTGKGKGMEFKLLDDKDE